MAALPVERIAPTPEEGEVARVLQVCNACRYCEGYCAVFPAMTRRLEFPKADVHYLANLCHNCGACLHACQYATPHPFAINVPKSLARMRAQTYRDYAWPPELGALYDRNGLTLSIALAAALAAFLALVFLSSGALVHTLPSGDFYRVLPHGVMIGVFLPVFAFAVLALGIGVARFWRDVSPGGGEPGAAAEAAHNVLRLKYLDGGHGDGCNETDDAFTLARRRWHHLVFYGFLLCFAATCVGTLYHYAFGWRAPYPLFSLPKLLGTVGGLSLVAGCVGLAVLNVRRDPAQGDAAQRPMDRGFLALLFLVAASGLALMLLRENRALGLLLALHLGAVLALFLTLPYGKFAHGVYRGAALLKWAIERRRRSPLGLAED